jgi:hypothetical protein
MMDEESQHWRKALLPHAKQIKERYNITLALADSREFAKVLSLNGLDRANMVSSNCSRNCFKCHETTQKLNLSILTS